MRGSNLKIFATEKKGIFFSKIKLKKTDASTKKKVRSQSTSLTREQKNHFYTKFKRVPKNTNLKKKI
jgi:hypothetical protein